MIPVTNLRNGACFIDGNDLLQVLNYEHVKLGRGAANIKVKTKNLKTGSITEKVFISGAKVAEANLDKKEAVFLYQKDGRCVFMDPVTFEQFEFFQGNLAEQSRFLKEGMSVKILFYEDEPLLLELSIKMAFAVSETGPEIRGNSATNLFKEAILENGLKLRVPLFVKIGDKIVVDTRTGEYAERL